MLIVKKAAFEILFSYEHGYACSLSTTPSVIKSLSDGSTQYCVQSWPSKIHEMTVENAKLGSGILSATNEQYVAF